jgi:hypothetical protein
LARKIDQNPPPLTQTIGRYLPSAGAGITPKTTDFVESKQPKEADRGWRIIAGPPLTAAQLYCALVGACEAIEATGRTNARYWREANAAAEAHSLIKRDSAPVNVTGGYRFPDAPTVHLSPTTPAATKRHAVATGNGLDIPDFLRRPALTAADPLRKSESATGGQGSGAGRGSERSDDTLAEALS